MLNKFIAPTPDKKLITKMIKFNRIFNLKGIPFLKKIPVLGRMVPITGVCDIVDIHITEEAEKTLSNLFQNDANAIFIGPNHPEFFTDWMLDKEISARHSPFMAFMATNEVVNGMGKKMQKFWLKNNICAHIPGTGSIEAKDYLIQSALDGHGALLHPEGNVAWHSDVIGTIYPGIFDMAYQALVKSKGTKNIIILPLTWKLAFEHNEHKALQKTIKIVRKKLDLVEASHKNLEDSLACLIKDLLFLIATKFKAPTIYHSIPQFNRDLTRDLCLKLAQETKVLDNYDDKAEYLKDIRKKIKNKELILTASAKKLLDEVTKLVKFNYEVYSESYITQENIAEILQKIRINYCANSFMDKIHKFIPRPVGPRSAYIGLGSPIVLNDLVSVNNNLEEVKEMALVNLKYQLQTLLNHSNEELYPTRMKYSNIFKK